MRPIERIPKLLETLEKVWLKYPDLRFMQLINMIQSTEGSDMFYVEDDELEKILKDKYLGDNDEKK